MRRENSAGGVFLGLQTGFDWEKKKFFKTWKNFFRHYLLNKFLSKLNFWLWGIFSQWEGYPLFFWKSRNPKWLYDWQHFWNRLKTLFCFHNGEVEFGRFFENNHVWIYELKIMRYHKLFDKLITKLSWYFYIKLNGL